MNLYALQVWSTTDEVWKTFYVSTLEDQVVSGMTEMETLVDRLFRVVEFTYDNLNFLGVTARDVKIIKGHRARA